MELGWLSIWPERRKQSLQKDTKFCYIRFERNKYSRLFFLDWFKPGDENRNFNLEIRVKFKIFKKSI